MKYVFILSSLFISSLIMGQAGNPENSGERILLENEKLKVVEFMSQPNGDVCGEGMHHHEPHLTVVVNDAKVQVTSEDGKSQDVEVASGTSIWFDAETHSVMNKGDKPTKMILVYLKKE